MSNDITHYLEAIAVEGLIEGMVSSAHRIETLLKYCPTDQGMYGPRRSPGERIVGLDDPERIERLARMVDFPGMLENNGCMGGSLALILERAQRGIDAGLDELTDEQRRCYMHASSYILLKSDGGDVCHAITLRQGMLRLEDSLTPDELLKVWWGKYPHGSWPRPGMLQSLTEVRAYACCMPYSDISYRRELTWRVWDELASLLRAGCIDTDDIVATRATTESLDHRDRANECLSYHRLVHEEGWDPDRAEAAVYFAMSLHQVIGENGFDLADDLLRWGDIAEELWDKHRDVCRCITAQADDLGANFCECYVRGTEEERALASIARGVLAALNKRDTDGAYEALRRFAGRYRGPKDKERLTFERLIIETRKAIANVELPENDWNWWVPLGHESPGSFSSTTGFQTGDFLGYLRFDPYCGVNNPLRCAKPIERYVEIGSARQDAERARDALWNARFTDGGDGGEANG